MPLNYSVIIPAFNEEEYLPTTLACLQESMHKLKEHGELIVVDNNSNDRTAEIAREYGARLIFEPVNQISRARNAGARAATGEYLIFLDADTLLNDSLLRAALEALNSGQYCGGGARVCLDGPLSYLPQLVLNFWNWVSRKYRFAAGCFVYCRRDSFEAAGGFSEAVYASEEIWLSRKLRIWGKQHNMKFLIIDTTPIVTSMRKLDWYTPGKILLFLLPILIFPPLLRVQYFCSHWYRRPGNSKEKSIAE
jgi:glycosyltransferase involved in cell wall biosynthesis